MPRDVTTALHDGAAGGDLGALGPAIRIEDGEATVAPVPGGACAR